MPRHKEPVKLLLAKGKTHLSKKDIEERERSELHVPFVDIVAPDYLTEDQREKFQSIADKLLALGIMTELDVDCLARYVLSYDLYLEYTRYIGELLRERDFAALKDAQNLQDKAFKHAQNAARDLGLTITSRCKIVVPTPPDDDDEL